MRKITTLALLMAGSCAFALTKPKVYLNPGHGGWSPNDRPLATISYPLLPETGRPDTCGFYESNTNLFKILELGRILKNTGQYYLKYSRKANGPFPWVKGAANETKYDRPLAEIAAEVDSYRPDYFISVHSNAAGDGVLANYPLFLYRGTDAENAVAGSKEMCTKMWPFHVEAMKAKFEFQSAYATSTNIRGDRDFYHYTWTNPKGYQGYLGVLMHGCPGYLVEGYFHTYQPSRHRALNPDWCGMEGRRYARGIIDYFGTTADTLGCIMGEVRCKSRRMDGYDFYTYSTSTNDGYLPLNGATVRLKNEEGYVVAQYQVDDNYNGIFVFTDLKPGVYYVDLYCVGYRTQQSRIASNKYTVKANQTSYKTHFMAVGVAAPLTPADEINDAVEEVPASDALMEDRLTVRLYDASGKLVSTTTRQQLDYLDLPAGIYVMESCGRTMKYQRR